MYRIPFLGFIFALVLGASYLLADSSIAGLFSSTLFSSPRGFLLLVVAPLSLILFLCFFVYSFISHVMHSGRSSRFGMRFFVLLAVIITVVALAITGIAGRFTGIAVSNWFDGSVPAALRSARDISDMYQRERELAIERVAFRFLNGLSIVNQRAMRRDWMEEIRVVDSYAVACQVYRVDDDGESPGYEAVIETGDMDYFLPHDELHAVRDGFFPRSEEDRVFRYGKLVRYSNETYVCVYSSLIPIQFFGKDALIREVHAESRAMDALERIMPYLGLWIFFMFCLPSVMMAILLGYAVILRIVKPVLAAEKAAALLAEGKAPYLLVPDSGDEAAFLAEHLNRMSEKITEGDRQGDKKPSLRV